MVSLAASALLLAVTAPAATFHPPTARPGDPVVLDVRGVHAEPRAEVAGRALGFYETGPGAWRAIAALPLEQPPGDLAVAVHAGDAVAVEPVAHAHLEVVAPRFRETRLTVPPRFVEPAPPEVAARIAEDRAAFLKAFDQPPTAPMFRRAFRLPRAAPMLAHFGELRTFNGETQGQHYGTDLKGRAGDPVFAANDGKVTLVRDAYMSGLSVVIAHGARLSSVYFHLSRAVVTEGDVVKRGQLIGRVGATGRSTGPHLHWGVRVGDLYVDPEAVLRLKL